MTTLPSGFGIEPDSVPDQDFMNTLPESTEIPAVPFLESSQLIIQADASPPFISLLQSVFPVPNMNLDEVMSSQAQPPSAAIHGAAAAYGLGVTSSLESALEPTTRSRANTIGSSPEPPAIPIAKAEEPAPELLASLSTKFFNECVL